MLGLFDWIFLGMFGAFAALDTLINARRFPKLRFWKIKGVLALVMYFALASYSPFLWDEILGKYRLIDATGLNFWVGVFGGFLVLELGIYVWHRLMHNTDFLWRWFHQAHHSAERVDIWGAFYFHPLDVIGFTFLGSFCLVFLFGIAPGPAAIVNTMAAFCTMFQHSNIKTPRWVGYIVTRPESHSVHHQRDVHAWNYSDLPLFDIIFGTFKNPKEWNEKAGLFDGGSARLKDLLLGRDLLKQ